MATFTSNNLIPLWLSNASVFSASSEYGPYFATANGTADSYVVRSGAFFEPETTRLYSGFFVKYTGTGFTYTTDGGGNLIPTGGAYTSVEILDRDGVTVFATLSGVSLSLANVFTQTYQSVFANVDTFNGGANAGEKFFGGDGDDVISSGGAATYVSFFGPSKPYDILFGGAGNDTLNGGAGTECLDGGAGNDTMSGGADDDVYFVDAVGGDTIIELDGGGDDLVVAAGSHTLSAGAYVERLITSLETGTQAINLTGNEFANLIFGNDGANGLSGGGGDDTLLGRAGNDNFWGGLGADRIYGGDGVDTLRFDYDGPGPYSGLLVSLTAPGVNTGEAAGDWYDSVENIILSHGNDIAYGNAVVNVIEGQGGDDYLFGFANDDRLFGGAGNDYLFGGLGADNLDGGMGFFDYACYDDAAYASFIVSLRTPSLNTGVAAGDTFTGIEGLILGLGDDVAYGDNGNNYIYGREGNDTIYGYEGDDTMFGGPGADRFIFDTSRRSDVIGDFVSGVDRIGLARAYYAAADLGDGTPRFAQGAPATPDATFVFDPVTRLLSYDIDGNGPIAGAPIVLLVGVATMTQSDLFFV